MAVTGLNAQQQQPPPSLQLRAATPVTLPEIIDGNSAAYWVDNRLHLLHSSGVPTYSDGVDQFQLSPAKPIDFDSEEHKPVWFEAAWRDDDGTLLLWYHHEPPTLCGGTSNLTTPKIGAALSFDDGKTVIDLGIVLESGDATDCNSRNGFFSGGHGDFSVILDRERSYFYFLFTNYIGPLEEQGVAIARLAFDDRYFPAGAVQKYYRGEWLEPGLGGHMTAVFPANRTWQLSNIDSFWGPSVHLNSAVNSYVVFLNRACCEPGWPQEGIYVAFTDDISDPESWTAPERILRGEDIDHAPGFYPQVLGLQPGETDSLASGVARLYIHGESRWEAVFTRPGMSTTAVE
jgi:hypothetical protein